MSKRFTQAATSCVRRLPPNPRTPRDRTRLFMPARTSTEVMELIKQLLMAGKTVPEVHDELLNRGVSVSRGPVDKVAFALEAAGLITRVRRVRAGLSKGGRPKGPGKKFSPNRDKVAELHASGMSIREIAMKVGMTRQGVERIIKSITDDKTQKTNC